MLAYDIGNITKEAPPAPVFPLPPVAGRGIGGGAEKAASALKGKLLTWRQRGWLWLRLMVRLLLALLAAGLIVWVGRPLLSLLAPFVAALVTAAILNPLVRRLQRRLCWSRRALTMVLLAVLFGLLGAGLGFLGYIAGQEIVALAQNWNGLLGSLQSMMDQLQALSDRLWALVPEQLSDPVQGAMSALLDWLNQTTPALVQHLADYTTDKAMGVPSFCVALVVYVMAAYFLTADYPYLRAKAARSMDQGLLAFLGEVKTVALGAFGGYLKAELLLSVGVFFILLGGFVLTRQPYGLLLALGLAVLDFIPIVGAGTVMVPWAVVELVTRNFSSAISLMVIWGVIALFRRAMEPKFVGDQTGLSPVLSLLSVYVGMKLGGVLGMILGPVLTLVVLNLAGMGLFRGLRSDLAAAAWDVAAILSRRPEDP